VGVEELKGNLRQNTHDISIHNGVGSGPFVCILGRSLISNKLLHFLCYNKRCTVDPKYWYLPTSPC
jgi:hypothetical protein